LARHATQNRTSSQNQTGPTFLTSSSSQPVAAKAPIDLLNQVARDLGRNVEEATSLDIKQSDLNDDGQPEYIVTYSCGAHRCVFHIYGKKEDRWIRLIEDGSSDGEYRIEITSTHGYHEISTKYIFMAEYFGFHPVTYKFNGTKYIRAN
jgi:hypothetical protein